ncbi:MAG: PorV/PorQ family protein [Fibrobacterota bacterium]
MKRILPILCLCAALSAQFSTLADVNDEMTGVSTLGFLKLPVGAKSVGLGGNAVSLLNDGSAVEWNPALLSTFTHNEVFLSHDEITAGLRHEYAGLVIPTFRLGVFGASWNLLRSGEIQNARDIDEQPVSASAADMSLALAWSHGLFDNRLSAGISAKYLQSRLATRTARGVATDLALSAALPLGLRTSIVVKNLGTPVIYDRAQEYAPFGVIGDVAGVFLKERLSVSAGAKKFNDAPLKVAGGAEYFILPAFCARAGYEYAYGVLEQAGGAGGLCGGIGIRYNAFKMDYGYARRSDALGGLHTVDAGFRFSQLVPPDDIDFYKRALRFFRQEQYRKCIAAAQQALEKNPNLWQAYVLIDEALRMMRVQEKAVIAVFYTGNTQGAFVPGSERAMGGLARRAGILKQLRADYPLALTLDAGNLLAAASDTVKQRFGYRLLRRMKYDAVNLGAGEYALGAAGVLQLADKAGIPCLASNLTPADAKVPVLEKWEARLGGKYVVTVFGVLPPATQPRDRAARIDEVAERLQGPLAEARKNSDLIVLLYADDLDACKAAAEALPGIDLIIAGGAGFTTYVPETVGKTLIVSPGAWGENVGFLSLQYNAQKRLVSYANKIHALDNNAAEDVGIRNALKSMTLPVGDTAESDTGMLPSPYLLPFTANYDVTAYHAPVRDRINLDSAAMASIGVVILRDSIHLDSVNALLSHKDSLRADSLIRADGLRGYADAADTGVQVYLRNLFTGKTKRISWDRRPHREPTVNNQGSALFYYSDTLTGKISFVDSVDRRKKVSTVHVYDVRRDLATVLPPERGNTIVQAAWAADGASLYTVERTDSTGRLELWLKAVGKKMKYNVSKTPDASEFFVAASPYGRNIAFTSDRDEGEQLYLSDPLGETPLRVTYGNGFCSQAAWSPDGQLLAFIYNAREKNRFGDCYVLHLRNNKVDTLSQNGRVCDLRWKSVEELVLTSGVNYTDLLLCDVKTHAMRRVTSREGAAMSERNPRVFDFGSGRVEIYYEVAGRERSYVGYTDLLTGTERKLFIPQGTYRLK